MPGDTTRPGRLLYIDNIRWLMIVFVVLDHAAVTYSGIGSWYYIEPAKLDHLSLLFFAFFQSFTQAYFMGLLFFIAGYFVPGAFDRKGFFRFIADRALRLGVPALIYMLFINTAIDYYILAFKWKMPRPSVAQYFMNYILSLDFLSGSGPMWFALALLIFTAVYGIIRISLPNPHGSKDENDREGNPPGHMTMIGLCLLISFGAFAIRLVQPIGTSIMNMELSFFSQYIVLFPAGIVAYRKNWLSRIPYSFGMAWFRSALIGGSAFWLAILVLGGGASGDLSRYYGGLYWQSAAYALWESFFCIGVSLGILVLFRERFNKMRRLERFASENYFSVYVFHPPILILVSLAIGDLAWPPLIKFVLAAAIAVPLCFLTSHLVLRRIPLLERVL